jgi:hypothetical protein
MQARVSLGRYLPHIMVAFDPAHKTGLSYLLDESHDPLPLPLGVTRVHDPAMPRNQMPQSLCRRLSTHQQAEDQLLISIQDGNKPFLDANPEVKAVHRLTDQVPPERKGFFLVETTVSGHLRYRAIPAGS